MQTTAKDSYSRDNSSGSACKSAMKNMEVKKKIAVVDDDAHIRGILSELLKKEGYQILEADSGESALKLLENSRPDLILLDLMMPGLSGEEILPLLRAIPVIILSAKGATQSKVDMLLGGAVDYVTKPFLTEELLARITVQLRRNQNLEAEYLKVRDIILKVSTMEVSLKGNLIRLTRTEYAILKFLMQNPGQVISRNNLLESIGSDTPDCTDRSLKQHVSNLRKKLEEASGEDYIETVWGIGFRLKS